MIERCATAFPVRLMCRCLQVSPSGYYGWQGRPLSQRARDNRALLERISTIHADSDGVFGSPRMCKELRYQGQHCSKNRVARLMHAAGLRGIPQRRRWRHKPSGDRPSNIRDHLDRDFAATVPNAKWVTDITLYLLPLVASRYRHARRGRHGYHVRPRVWDVDVAPRLTFASPRDRTVLEAPPVRRAWINKVGRRKVTRQRRVPCVTAVLTSLGTNLTARSLTRMGHLFVGLAPSQTTLLASPRSCTGSRRRMPPAA